MKPSDSMPLDARDAAMVTWINDFAPYGVITTDRDFRIQSWNHWMEIHSGRVASSVIGQELFKLYPDLADRNLLSRFHRALEGEVSVLSTSLHGYLFQWPSAIKENNFPVMRQTARIAPFRYEKETIGTIIIIEDVTEREAQALVLRRQHYRDNILAWALAYLAESPNPRQSIRDIFCKVVEQYDFDAYMFYLRDATDGALRLQAMGGILADDESRLALLENAASPGKQFFDVAQTRVLENLRGSDAKENVLSEQFGFRALVVVPLIAAEERLGALCFGTRTRNKLEEGEGELLATIGQYLAVALSKEATRLKLHDAQEKLSDHALGLEKQIQERTAKLRDTITELETFSHSIAHDLRAPIRAMIGYCEILSEDYAGQIPKEGGDIVTRLSAACQRLDHLTRDLLAFARVSRQEVQLTRVNVEAVLTEVLDLGTAPTGSVTVQHPLLPVLGHKTMLQQCLANLIDNAAKFIPAGAAPQITVYTELIPANTARPVAPLVSPFTSARLRDNTAPAHEASSSISGPVGERVRIVVKDKGIGVESDAQGKIFGIFERASSSPLYPGSGMGLAIVARAMQRMGGACGVESKPGQGSTFWLELPTVR